MHLFEIILFLSRCIFISQSINLTDQYTLIDHFLTVKNLDSAVIYTCWPFSGNACASFLNKFVFAITRVIVLLIHKRLIVLDTVANMKRLNENKIGIIHREIKDFDGNLNLKDVFAISLHYPTIGIIVDWSCQENMAFQVYYVLTQSIVRFSTVLHSIFKTKSRL